MEILRVRDTERSHLHNPLHGFNASKICRLFVAPTYSAATAADGNTLSRSLRPFPDKAVDANRISTVNFSNRSSIASDASKERDLDAVGTVHFDWDEEAQPRCRGDRITRRAAPIALEPLKEISMERDLPTFRRSRKWGREDVYEEHETAVVRIGAALVEATFSDCDDVSKPWVRKIMALARSRRLRAPLLVGLVTFGGHAPCVGIRNRVGPRPRPSRPANTVRCIALCVGGSHTLVYQPSAPWEPTARVDGKIEFHRNNMQSLQALLGDSRITVACLGADEAAKELAKSWGLHVDSITDLKDLVGRAYGEVVQVSTRVHGRWENSTAMVMVKDLGMEELATLVLGQDVQVDEKPAKVRRADWSRALGDDEVMYATQDAYLCFEIALRCLEKLGIPTKA